MVVAAVIKELRKAKPRQVLLAEALAIGCDTLQCLEASGIGKAVEEAGVDKIIDIKREKDLIKIPKILKNHLIQNKHPRVSSTINADLWFEPKIVLEIMGAEITLSPIHTCAKNSIRKERGLAIRFPRFTGKYRSDKNAEDATTSKEITKMYQRQLKQISNLMPN